MKFFAAVIIISSLNVSTAQIRISINQYTELQRPDTLEKVKYCETMYCNNDGRDCQGTKEYYDSLGRLIEKWEIDDDEIAHKYFYKYNINNQLTEMIHLGDNGKQEDREVYKYDSLKRRIEFIDYDSRNKVDRRVTCSYNNTNDTMVVTQYDGAKKFELKTVYTDKSEEGHYQKGVQTDVFGTVQFIYKRRIDYWNK